MYSDIHEMHSNYYKDKCELIVRDLNLTSSGLLQNFDINNIKIFYSLCSPFLSPAKIKTKRGIQEKIKKHFWVCDSDVSECQGFGNSTSSIIFSLNKKNPKILQIRFNGSEVNFNLVFDENLKKVDSLHFDKNSLNITIHLNSDDNKVASGQIEQNSIQRNLLLNEKKKGKDEKKEENEKRKGQNDRINGENNKKKEEIVLKDEYSTSDETLDESVCESDFDNFSTTKEVENESQPSESLDFAYQNEDISDSSEIETHLSQISLETIETQTKSEQDYETNSFSNDLFPTNSLDFENGSNSDETEKTDDTSNTEIESSTSETETFQATLSPSENFTFYPLIPETAPYEVVNDFFLTYLIYVNDTHYIFVSEFEIYDENTISNLSVKVPQYNVDYPMIFRASFSNKLVGPPQINDNFVYPYVLDNTSTIWCCWKPDPEILDKDYCHQIADYRYGFYVLPSIPDLESSIMISIKGLYNTSTLINLFCDDEQAIKEANYYVNESAIEYSLDIYTPASCPHKFVEDFIPTYQPTPTMSQQLGTRLHFSVPYTNKTMLVFDLDKAETALDNLMLFVDETGKIENTRVTCGLSAVVGCPETKTCSIYTFSNIWKCGKTECIPIGDFRYGLNFTACLEEFIQNYEDETDFSGMEIILTYSGGANGITTMVHLFCNYNFDNIQFDMHGVHFTNGTYQISGVSQYACPMVLPYSPASSFTYFSNTPGSNGNSNLSNPNNTYLAIGIIAGIIVIIVAAILVTHFATRKTDHREVVEDSSDLLDDSEQSQAEQL